MYDAVLFIKKNGSLVNTYWYGMIHQLEWSKDNLIRKFVLKWKCEQVYNPCSAWTCVNSRALLIDKLYSMEDLGNTVSTNSVTVNVNKRK